MDSKILVCHNVNVNVWQVPCPTKDDRTARYQNSTPTGYTLAGRLPIEQVTRTTTKKATQEPPS